MVGDKSDTNNNERICSHIGYVNDVCSCVIFSELLSPEMLNYVAQHSGSRVKFS